METCCETCRYSEPMVGALCCMGQKGMPYVRPTDYCDSWKSNKKTRAEWLRGLTDNELADFLDSIIHDWGEGTFTLRGNPFVYVDDWREWLRGEMEE